MIDLTQIILRHADETARLRAENERLSERLRKLDALEANGVDNWQWYDDAMASIVDGA